VDYKAPVTKQKKIKKTILTCVSLAFVIAVSIFFYRAAYMYQTINRVIYCEGFADTSLNQTGNEFWYWIFQRKPQGRCISKEEDLNRLNPQ
jgi:hypothetical protein